MIWSERSGSRLSYAAGLITGLVLCGIIGYFKNLFIWENYLRKNDEAYAPNEAGSLYGRMFASNIVNVAALAAVFFARDLMPFDGITFLVGTAIGLTVMSRRSAFRKKRENKREEEL